MNPKSVQHPLVGYNTNNKTLPGLFASATFFVENNNNEIVSDGRTMIQYVIESILDNESITDGLDDTRAQRIIQWCIAHVEAFQPQNDQALTEYGHHLAQQARTVTKIANHIQDGDDVSRIRRRLQRLTADSAKQQSFLALLNSELTLDEYIEALLKIADCE